MTGNSPKPLRPPAAFHMHLGPWSHTRGVGPVDGHPRDMESERTYTDSFQVTRLQRSGRCMGVRREDFDKCAEMVVEWLAAAGFRVYASRVENASYDGWRVRHDSMFMRIMYKPADIAKFSPKDVKATSPYIEFDVPNPRREK